MSSCPRSCKLRKSFFFHEWNSANAEPVAIFASPAIWSFFGVKMATYKKLGPFHIISLHADLDLLVHLELALSDVQGVLRLLLSV